MSDLNSSSGGTRPSATNTRSVTGLLGSRRTGPLASSPIPPSLQAKMAAMANRGAQQANANANAADITAAMNNVSLAERALPSSTSVQPSPIHLVAQGPNFASPPGGLAARRLKANAPKLNVNDISDVFPSGGGPSGAGLGAGRPSLGQLPRRSPQATLGTPFSNFRKIVDPSGALNFSGKACHSCRRCRFL
ncbi:hypothetical protein QCA50_004614 [Cerrena zonata]|uniref:Uncharacterized protein n=1 Tax=Cerrena zonata TaxID=2478898 RepID=A0AAW0GRZ9_9APHY